MAVFGKGAKYAALAYLAYVAGAGVLAYLWPVGINEKDRKWLDAVAFEGENEGPDAALLAEDGREAFARRAELARAARKTLDITIYTLKPGPTTPLVLAEILKAADRGVRVRLLASGKTNKLSTFPALRQALTGHPNIEVRLFNPLRPHTPWKWNVMMHDKMMIADDERLTLGGRNIGDEYCSPPGFCGRSTQDREVFVLRRGREEGSVLPAATAYFDSLWHHRDTHLMRGGKNSEQAKQAIYRETAAWLEKNPEFFQPGMPLAQAAVPTNKITLIHNPVTTFKKEPWCGYQLFKITNAASRARVQTPYMTDNRMLLSAVEKTSAGGRLEVLTNSLLSSPNLPAFSEYLFSRGRFLRRGARLWEYQSKTASIHGKSILAGDLAAVGSCNLDDRSLFIDTETMLVVHSKPFSAALGTAMDALQSQSLPVEQNGRYSKPAETPSLAKRISFKAGGLVFRVLRFLV